MSITVPCGCGDSGKKRYLKAIVVQTVRIYTNYSALSLVPETYMPCIETHMPKNLFMKEPKLVPDLQLQCQCICIGRSCTQIFY